jgi:hypothetical protein
MRTSAREATLTSRGSLGSLKQDVMSLGLVKGTDKRGVDRRHAPQSSMKDLVLVGMSAGMSSIICRGDLETNVARACSLL